MKIIHQYIEDNPGSDSVDICGHFFRERGYPVTWTLWMLGKMEKAELITRHYQGLKTWYTNAE